MRHALIFFLTLCLCPAVARAGLYYSGEPFADLPSQWRGFLLDQRALRLAGVRPPAGAAVPPLRAEYEAAAGKLESLERLRPLTAGEQADLGALYVRLGEPGKAVALLRAAKRQNPGHFTITANLGTAWQLQGDLTQADAALADAVRLAPADRKRAEELHLKLVRLRQREPKGAQTLDDLFGVHYVGDGGGYEPGQLARVERAKLPDDAVGLTQLLALWLPADGRLLWQLAELAAANGDVRTAAAIMDGCVDEFGLRDPELRRHRLAMRAAADLAAKTGTADRAAAQAAHEAHAGGFRPRSKRPLVRRAASATPPIVAGVNAPPWSAFAETTLDRKYRPTFPAYLKEFDGKDVVLEGYMQPIGEDAEFARFMLVENPIGCWYCEAPDMTGIVAVEMPGGSVAPYSRARLRVRGKLALNGSDPENFLYIITNARVSEAD